MGEREKDGKDSGTAGEEGKNGEGKELRMLGLDPVETRHCIDLAEGSTGYRARAGVVPLRDDTGDVRAEVFFTAYELEGETEPSGRPLTFVFNGGPGSSSVWLHLGALGPRRVVMEPEGWMPEPPFRLEDNMHTWLDETDLVFVDPVGTGFSRAAKPDLYGNYHSYGGDIESVGDFIRLYLSKYGRWSSPLFLAGESYGTTRAAGLAADLFDKGIAFNGIVLISTALDLRPIVFGEGDDLPFQLFVPTYAATAWYHRKLCAELLECDLPDLAGEVEEWVGRELAPFLMKGDGTGPEERAAVSEELSRYTGLSKSYVMGSNMRVHMGGFCKELLRDERRSVGRLDSRFRGIESVEVNEKPEFDPSMASIVPPYTSMINDYLRRELEVDTDMEYKVWMDGELRKKWEWEKGKLPTTGEKLRLALAVNPHMKVLVCQGYYDLATPLMATKYMLSHMNIDPELRDCVRLRYYRAGHMFYLDLASLEAFRKDAGLFIRESVRKG